SAADPEKVRRTGRSNRNDRGAFIRCEVQCPPEEGHASRRRFDNAAESIRNSHSEWTGLEMVRRARDALQTLQTKRRDWISLARALGQSRHPELRARKANDQRIAELVRRREAAISSIHRLPASAYGRNFSK